MYIIYSLLDGQQPLEEIIDNAATLNQAEQTRRQEIMNRQEVLPRILARGVPRDKAIELTERSTTNQKGPVNETTIQKSQDSRLHTA